MMSYEIGSKVRELRLENKLTQNELAKNLKLVELLLKIRKRKDLLNIIKNTRFDSCKFKL